MAAFRKMFQMPGRLVHVSKSMAKRIEFSGKKEPARLLGILRLLRNRIWTRRTRSGILVGISFLLLALLIRQLLPAPPSGIRLAFSHFETTNGVECAVFQLSNAGNSAVTCYGYGWQKPFYLMATWSGTNWLWDHMPGFDQDLIRPIRLPSRSKMTVRAITPCAGQWIAGVECPERWLVGIEYTPSSVEDRLPYFVWCVVFRLKSLLPKKQSAIVWSEPLTRLSKPKNLVSDSARFDRN